MTAKDDLYQQAKELYERITGRRSLGAVRAIVDLVLDSHPEPTADGEALAQLVRDGEAGKPVGHRSLRDRFPESFKDYQTPSWIEEAEDSDEPLKVFSAWDCPDGPHRGPEGPNEDLGQCAKCWSLSHVLRPEGETFGHHLSDCSLPIRHGGECIGGGTGHPAAPKVRGPRALDGEAHS